MGIAAATAGVTAAAPGCIAVVFFHNIMVAVQQIEAFLPVKLRQQLKHITVTLNNLCHVAIFPQFVPISQLDVGISRFQIMLQGSSIERLIFQKVIIGTADAPMTVAEKHIF